VVLVDVTPLVALYVVCHSDGAVTDNEFCMHETERRVFGATAERQTCLLLSNGGMVYLFL